MRSSNTPPDTALFHPFLFVFWSRQAQGHRVSLPTMEAALTAREQELFDLLSSNRGRLFSRSDLLERVWGLAFEGDDQIVDVYVRRIRLKMGEETIKTVRGVGYRCPQSRAEAQAWPHVHHLSPDARTVLRLGRRVLSASSVREVLTEVHAALDGAVRVAGVALLTAQTGAALTVWNILDTAGEAGLDWQSLPQPARPAQPHYAEDWQAGQPQSARQTRSGQAAPPPCCRWVARRKSGAGWP